MPALAIIHLALPHDEGRITSYAHGPLGDGQRAMPVGSDVAKFDILCSPERIPEHFTGETVAVTCPDCQKHPLFAKLYKDQNRRDFVPSGPNVVQATKPPVFAAPEPEPTPEP